MVRDAWKVIGARAVNSSTAFSQLDSPDDDIDSFFDISEISDFCDIPPPPPPAVEDTSAPSQQLKAAKATEKALTDALEGVDLIAVKQAHANCIAGALLGLAMRFAGTADEGAKQTILFFARHFKVPTLSHLFCPLLFFRLKPFHHCIICYFYVQSLRDGKYDASCSMYDEDTTLPVASLTAKTSARKPDRVTLETCVCVSALALACVMAGTGDLESLKLIRSLYFKVPLPLSFHVLIFYI